MGKTFSFLLVLALGVVAANVAVLREGELPLAVNYVSAEETPYIVSTTTLVAAPAEAWIVEAPAAALASTPEPKLFRAEVPVRIIIPSIDLDTRIIPVGINGKGEMAVPSGSTNDVGWYKNGPKPGQSGSTVLDAHVFAAFKNLRYVKVGEDIIVETESGQRLRFIVRESTVFKLSDLTSHMLFGRGGDQWLNLITCAGRPTGDTYSHRLIVYSTFEEVL